MVIINANNVDYFSQYSSITLIMNINDINKKAFNDKPTVSTQINIVCNGHGYQLSNGQLIFWSSKNSRSR